MNKKITNTILLLLIVLGITIGTILYPYFPNQIASHWNMVGEVNGYMSKFWGVFLLPMILVGLFGLYHLIPAIDPLRKNLESFRRYYNLFWIFLFLFLSYIFGLTLIWNLGYHFSFSVPLTPAFSLLWFFLGLVLPKSKRNWFFGIRTPWTLANDVVWEKTHRVGGKFFMITAIAALFGIVFPKQSIWFILIPVFATVIFTVIYSYLVYRRLEKK